MDIEFIFEIKRRERRDLVLVGYFDGNFRRGKAEGIVDFFFK